MRCFVGTSGWAYDWNEGGDLKWYVTNSRLNAIELNMSFYRFPFPSQVNSWAKYGSSLAWLVKVNRLITHVFRLNDRAYKTWIKFKSLFSKLDPCVHFYLFQLPPTFTPKFRSRVEAFVRRSKLGSRFALEFRNEVWFTEENVEWAKKMGITLVSVDAPEFPLKLFLTSDALYLRMHGKTAWYAHEYSRRELEEVVERILELRPKRVYVMFNNDHAMLRNAREMLELLIKMC